MDIDNFVECDIEHIYEVAPSDLTKLEQLIWREVDMDEQKFINIASIFANFYGDVVCDFANKWNRS